VLKTKALFLDRDGIINVDHGYVYKVEDFEFVEGIFEFIKLFTSAGYMIFIVTNQSGIGRKYYDDEDFTILTDWMIKKFTEENITIEQVYSCHHSPEERCHCRKPETGMIEQALEQYSIDLGHSWMIGDKRSDIALAENAAIGYSVYIGNTTCKEATFSFTSLMDAKRYFQENKDKILS